MSNALAPKVFPAIPHPKPDTESHNKVLLALKESVETLTRQRGNPENSVITWADMVALGVIDKSQIPSK